MVHGQDVEGFFGGINQRIAAGDYLRVRGNAGLRASYNYFDGEGRRNAPFVWGGSAGLNLDFLGIQAPFSVAFSSRNTLYNLPSYSFAGISPSYKWITLHAGDRSMSFSPYSLSGTNFRGAGFELRPGKFYVAGMRGRLRRARIQDVGLIQSGLETSYRRIGQGLKAGYDNQQGTSATLSLFSSADDMPTEGIDSATLLRPERNLVLTLSASHDFSDFLSFSTELAQSVLTRDETAPFISDPTGSTRLLGLFKPRTSTTAASAYNGTVTLNPEFGSIDLKYERVGPGYRTHGSLFFQNDLENFTAGLRAPLFKQKLQLAANVGVQRNDLDGNQASNLKRLIGSLNLNYQWSERTSSTLGLSNFTSTNRFRALSVDNLVADSLVLAQTQFGIDASTTVILDDARSQVLLLNASWQRADLIRNEAVDTTAGSGFGMLMAGYSYQPSEGKSSLSGSVILHRNVTPQLTILTLGPTVSYTRAVWKDRVNLSVGGSYNLTYANFTDPNVADGQGGDGLVQLNFGAGVKVGDKQSINLTATFLNAAESESRPGYSDGLIGLQYGYSF